jgi:hypothetical protein
MLQAVKDGHLITWPGLTEDAINKHLKLTPATAMGHMNQKRQNIRSTSKTPIADQPTPDNWAQKPTSCMPSWLIKANFTQT